MSKLSEEVRELGWNELDSRDVLADKIAKLEEQLQASRSVCRALQIELVEALAEMQEKK